MVSAGLGDVTPKLTDDGGRVRCSVTGVAQAVLQGSYAQAARARSREEIVGSIRI